MDIGVQQHHHQMNQLRGIYRNENGNNLLTMPDDLNCLMSNVMFNHPTQQQPIASAQSNVLFHHPTQHSPNQVNSVNSIQFFVSCNDLCNRNIRAEYFGDRIWDWLHRLAPVAQTAQNKPICRSIAILNIYFQSIVTNSKWWSLASGRMERLVLTINNSSNSNKWTNCQ